MPMKYDQRYAGIKLNRVTKVLPVINNFDQNCPSVTLTMGELKVIIFDHLDIPYFWNVDSRLRYTECIQKGTTCTKFQETVKL